MPEAPDVRLRSMGSDTGLSAGKKWRLRTLETNGIFSRMNRLLKNLVRSNNNRKQQNGKRPGN